MTTIPVIDVSALADPGGRGATLAARHLCKAYEDLGFAYITGHGIAEQTVEDCFAASRQFHAAPAARKQSIAINEFHRGYMAFATSTVVTSTVARNTTPNLSESVLVMHEVSPDEPRYGKPLQGPNLWPDWLPEFRPAVETYMAEFEALSRRLLNAFTICLGLPRDFLTPMFEKPTTFLRLLHYPPHPPDAPDGQFGSAPHTDYGCMTILAQDASGGLQVRRPDGGWIDAPPRRDAFVLNLGDLMPRWSNGRFKSTPHRVLNFSGRDRYSLPFFFDPDMETLIECLPGCCGPGNPSRFEKIQYGDYLMYRLNKNYDYRKSA